jgi:hypothetical protein
MLELMAFVLAIATAASAQTAGNSPSLAGSRQDQPASTANTDPNPWRNLAFGVTLEAYYQYDWNTPPNRIIPLRAYDTRANTFGIQQIAFVIDAPPDVDADRRYGLRADLQWGQATETLQGSPANEPRPDVYRNLWQVYGTYLFPVGPKGLQTDFGKFASMLGYETNYAKDNQAFSRAYLFNFLPFYHSGLRVTYPVNDNVSVLYMLTNGIQQTEDFNDYKSNHLAAIVKPVSQLMWTVNYYFGQEQSDQGEPGGPDGFFRVFDTYASYTPVAAVSLALDLNYVTNELTTDAESRSTKGLGAYARYQLTAPIGLGVRYERLDDEGLFGGVDQLLQEVTITAEYKFADGFLFRGEFRRDWSDELFFPGPLGVIDLRDHQNTLLIGGIWVIGNKKGPW